MNPVGLVMHSFVHQVGHVHEPGSLQDSAETHKEPCKWADPPLEWRPEQAHFGYPDFSTKGR